MTFLDIRFLDILDIFLVAYLLYQVYMFIKGTVAINIFVGIFSIYLVWLLVKALNMQLIGSILGQVMGVGMIALIIVFQQELRRFFLLMGTRYFSNKNFSLEYLFSFFIKKEADSINIASIVTACRHMALTKTGALIVIAKESDLTQYASTGEIFDAETGSRLIETIFFKNSPLHDGAMIIKSNKIHAASCVLPVSESNILPKNLGLRHRAAMGIAEVTDAFVVIVSEESGYISYAQYGRVITNITPGELTKLLENQYSAQKSSEKDSAKKKYMKKKFSENKPEKSEVETQL